MDKLDRNEAKRNEQRKLAAYLRDKVNHGEVLTDREKDAASLLGVKFESGSNIWTGDRQIYSVAYEVELPSHMYPGVSDARHFQEANRQLHEAFEREPQFAQAMETLYPGIIEGVNPGKRGSYPRTKPTKAVTWHHEVNRAGILQLIPINQHRAKGKIQSVLHPNGKGGMENWGGGRKRKK